jgi:hypothetical protein
VADEYVVERSLHVAAPPSALYERIVDLRRWQSWSPWEDLDPQLQRTYDGPEQGVGASYGWSGNRRAGTGRMAVTEAVEDEHVALDLVFEKPFKSQSITTFDLESDANGTLVTWRMRGSKTVMTRVMGLFTSMDKIVGPDFEKGLDRLRAAAEAD